MAISLVVAATPRCVLGALLGSFELLRLANAVLSQDSDTTT
jgi:hypothetical protein